MFPSKDELQVSVNEHAQIKYSQESSALKRMKWILGRYLDKFFYSILMDFSFCKDYKMSLYHTLTPADCSVKNTVKIPCSLKAEL